MKRHLLLPLLAIVLLTGCSTYQYSARYLDINRQPIDTKEISAEVVIDFNHRVTATSTYCQTKSDAIREAEFFCLANNKIDVIVDPIFKVEHTPMGVKNNKYRVTVIGYAGKYRNAPTGVDAALGYDMSDIEKYKMITDPSFPEHYYSKPAGDTYYFNTKGEVVSDRKDNKKETPSLAVAPVLPTPKVRPVDINKSKKLRNAGIGMTIAGAASMLAIGAPCLTAADKAYDEYFEFGTEYDPTTATVGTAFIVAGAVTSIIGIPCWIAGSVKMKKANKRGTEVSMGGTKNGVGVSLRF